MNSKISKFITYFGLFLFFTGTFYLVFDKFFPAKNHLNSKTSTQNNPTPTVKTGFIQFAGPKTEVCPLNSALYTTEEKAIWSTRRPLAVMIENHLDSRPQSGLQSADIVYEAVAEGGITRFMGVFYCGAVAASTNKYDVGPVRSARTYFLDLASEYADYPLYAHVGGANCSGGDSISNTTNCTTDKRAQALEQISKYGWTSKGTWGDLNQFSLSYQVCRREPERTGEERATEHTMYCSTTELWKTAAARGLTNMTIANKVSWDKNYRPWSFKQTESPSSTPVNSISFDFWPGYKDYSVTWTYDTANNRYLRANDNTKQIDFNTKEQLFTKNLIVQYAKETKAVDEHGHLLYGLIGTGKGMLFQNGNKQEITWIKANRTSRTIFKTTDGKEVNFIPGQVWVEILPVGNTIRYEGQP